MSDGLERFGSWDALAAATAGRAADALAEGLRERGRAGLALAGGRTPSDIYRRLARHRLNWKAVSVTLTDERWVPSASPDSNTRLLRETLLREAAAETTFLPLKTDGDAAPETAAKAADARLAEVPWPLDLVLLGMGNDGHVASLFPGSPALAAGLDPDSPARCLAVPAGEPAPPQPRLSLTLRAVLDARRVFIVIRGADKLDALERARGHSDVSRAPVLAVLGQDRSPVHILWAP